MMPCPKAAASKAAVALHVVVMNLEADSCCSLFDPVPRPLSSWARSVWIFSASPAWAIHRECGQASGRTSISAPTVESVTA
jgi:hypothetical protein